MVIRLRFEVRVLREDLDRLAARPGQHRPSSMSSSASESSSSPAYGEGDEQLRSLVAKGRKIEAIKKAREMYNMSLKEAKDYVESL
ncbi:hypothetical protein CDO73_13685 [Saccharibacillus sp. O23]|nr:hypothetical protein CDO73_13685 [Saccharibacillus sp. O23]